MPPLAAAREAATGWKPRGDASRGDWLIDAAAGGRTPSRSPPLAATRTRLGVPRPNERKRAATLLIRPFQEFFELEAASGILLLGAAVVALVWANSPLAASYFELWDTPVSVHVGVLGVRVGAGARVDRADRVHVGVGLVLA